MATNITEFRPWIRTDVIGCPINIVDQAIRDAIVQVCKDVNLIQKSFEHEVDADGDVDATDNDSIEIDLSDYVSETLRPYSIQELKIDGSIWSTLYKEFENDVDDLDLYSVSNTKFFNFPDVGTLKLFPMDLTEDVKVFLDIHWIPLRTMTTIDDVVYNDHRKAVEEWAKYILMEMKGEKWYDKDEAERKLRNYSREMENGKIHRLYGYTKGSLRVKSLRYF